MNSCLSEARNFCTMRHNNGNCLPCGGFCTAVNDEICASLKNAYAAGYSTGYRNGRTASPMVEENTDERQR